MKSVQAIVVLLLLAWSTVFAQTNEARPVHISGQATDTCGLALVNADVKIKRPVTGETVATARVTKDGEFDTPVIPPGIYTLQIDTPEAEPFSQTVDASKGDVDFRVVATTKLVVCGVTQPPVRTQRTPAPQALDDGTNALAGLPRVEERGGNIYFTGKDGHAVQLTSTGLDSSPSLSKDNSLVVFLREKYFVRIFLSRGLVWDNVLWVADTSRKRQSYPLLVGNDGLGKFRHPQFSPDGRRICFEARSWATDYSMWVLELASHRVSHSETGDCR